MYIICSFIFSFFHIIKNVNSPGSLSSIKNLVTNCYVLYYTCKLILCDFGEIKFCIVLYIVTMSLEKTTMVMINVNYIL